MAAQTVDKEKSLVLTQILYLEEQLENCQLTLCELEKQNKDLVCQYSALEKTKKEKTEELKQLVRAEEKKVEDLSEQLKEQQQRAKEYKARLKQYCQYLKEDQLELTDEYHQKSIKLAEDLAEKKKQIIVLKQQESELEAMEKQLVNLPEEQEAEIQSLKINLEAEIKMLEEKFKTQTESLSQLSTVLVMERATNRKHRKMISFLLNENSALSEELEALNTRLKDLNSSKQDLAKEIDALIQQNATLEKEVDQLWQMCRQLNMEKAECLSNHTDAQNETETLRSCLTKTSEQYHQKVVTLGRLEAELQKETSRRRQLEDVKQKAAVLLKHILTDDDKPSEARWKTQRLVEILENSTLKRTGSNFNSSTKRDSQGQKPHV